MQWRYDIHIFHYITMHPGIKVLFQKIGVGIVIIFAVIGFGLTAGYFAVKFGWTNTTGVIDIQRQAFLDNANQSADASASVTESSWESTPEWATLKEAILKDQGVINRAAVTAGVPSRLIVESLVAEQLR